MEMVEMVNMVNMVEMVKMVTKMGNELDCLVHLPPLTANVIAPTARITNHPQHCIAVVRCTYLAQSAVVFGVE